MEARLFRHVDVLHALEAANIGRQTGLEAEEAAYGARRRAEKAEAIIQYSASTFLWNKEYMATLVANQLGNIFLSYRRSDSEPETALLEKSLKAHLPDAKLFLDSFYIQPGEDFQKAILEVLWATSVMLVVIGDSWLTASDKNGRRRLDLLDDYVRFEIVTGLSKDILVLPILVHNAQMPTKEELPEELRPLSAINALRIREATWDIDVQQLIRMVSEELRRREQSAQKAQMPHRQHVGSDLSYVTMTETPEAKYQGEIMVAMGKNEHVQLAHGKGKLSYPDGRIYTGLFNQGECVEATLHYIDGDKYEGHFQRGMFNGLGAYEFADGRRVACQWRENKKHGYGHSLVANGCVYDGEYRDDVRYSGALSQAGQVKEFYISGASFQVQGKFPYPPPKPSLLRLFFAGLRVLLLRLFRKKDWDEYNRF
jgi:hypothetical protein